jgi:hypothetical protein
MNNTTPPKNRGWTQVLLKGKQLPKVKVGNSLLSNHNLKIIMIDAV